MKSLPALAFACLLAVLAGCSGTSEADRRRGRVAESEVDTQARTDSIKGNIDRFASDSVLERYRGIRNMLDLGRSADPYLIDALGHPSARVRMCAKQACIFQDDPEMLQSLYGAFRQAHLQGQTDAATAGLFGLISQGRPAIPYFIRLLGEDRAIRQLAAYALSEILEVQSSQEVPGADDPNLVTFWQDWWSRNKDTFVDPLSVVEPVAISAKDASVGLQERDYFRSVLAQQRFRMSFWFHLGEADDRTVLDPWRDAVASLGAMRRDPQLRAMDRDLLGVMIAMCFEVTGRGMEASDVLAAIVPGPEHGGGAPILQHFVALAQFWAWRRQGENPKAAEALEAAIGLAEAGAVPRSLGLRRLYRLQRAFFEEWSAVR